MIRKTLLSGLMALLCLSAAAAKVGGGGFYASGPKDRPEFALTFDDGPGFITEDLLRLLDKRAVKATFFVLGSSARRYPQRVKMLAEGGHLIASHTDTHKNWFSIGKSSNAAAVLISELKKASDSIYKASGVRPTVLRMPNGYDRPWVRQVGRDHRYTLVNWTYGSDWTKQSDEKLAAEYLKALKPGAILLMHDGGGKNRLRNLRLVEKILDEAELRGLKPVRVDDLLGLRDPLK